MSRIQAGAGRIVLRTDGSEAVFTELSCTYPLKLLSPRTSQQNVRIVYVLTYGGGLVGGDRIALTAQIEENTILVMLSQGSTKVFKDRPGERLSARSHGTHSAIPTTQRMDILISSNGALFLLPDPVTCFRAAKYNQLQVFHLHNAASIVLLDWVTSGRKSIGEEWVFSMYYSLNEVWVDGERLAKDVMFLQEQDDVQSLPRRTLANTLAPYSCYATLILYGATVQSSLRHLAAEFEAITVFKHSSPPDLIWSFSLIREGKGCVVRVAARETEDVKHWLGGALKELESVIGVDVYRRAFN
ncbi:UreD-domain-containing protein [Sparassis latifolia]